MKSLKTTSQNLIQGTTGKDQQNEFVKVIIRNDPLLEMMLNKSDDQVCHPITLYSVSHSDRPTHSIPFSNFQAIIHLSKSFW